MTRVRGGQNQYGFTVGVLILDTRASRALEPFVAGHIVRHGAGWRFEVDSTD